MNTTEALQYEALKLGPHTGENCDSEIPGTIFSECQCGEQPFWPPSKTAHCTSGLGLTGSLNNSLGGISVDWDGNTKTH